MGDVVNLRQVRKAKSRDEKDAQAAENRIRHGQTKHERTLTKTLDRLVCKRLDGHKLPTKADGK